MHSAVSTHEHQDASRKTVIAAIAMIAVAYFGWLGVSAVVSETAEIPHATAPADDPATSAPVHADHHAEDADEHHAAATPALYSVVPFVLLLLGIAILPLMRTTAHWWEHNRNRFLVAAGLGAITLLYYGLLYGHGVVDHGTHALSQPGWQAAWVVFKNALLVEYIPFIVLLFSLFVISGGVAIEGHLVGRPSLNTTIIGIGAVLASFIGTTGAAMLLIRPLLRANAQRTYVAHTVVFFIFVVCNTGGCLLPIGDPPLFLGYLRGVPFLWTMQLWPMWLFMNLSLLAVYFAWDTFRYRSENREHIETTPENPEPFRISGAINFLWLFGVILAVALLDPSKALPGTDWHAPVYFREVVMLSLAAVSLATTSPLLRHRNDFSYTAIIEVAALFVGIFICMQSPIQLLNEYGPQLGIDAPWKFYWGTGSLSSFLDNAPTYVVFFETARAMPSTGPTVAGVEAVTLMAISLGSVFMGAMTYIGNGPNFMVKAIAETNNVRMPSFFGYMLYSCAVLLPLSVLLTVLFF